MCVCASVPIKEQWGLRREREWRAEAQPTMTVKDMTKFHSLYSHPLVLGGRNLPVTSTNLLHGHAVCLVKESSDEDKRQKIHNCLFCALRLEQRLPCGPLT